MIKEDNVSTTPATLQAVRGLDSVATEAYAHLFQAFAEPTRLAIVQHLATGEHRVRDLVDHMGLAQSTVSKHIAFLAECGIVRMRPEGRASWYALTDSERLRALMNAAQGLLAETGNTASLCRHLHDAPTSVLNGEVDGSAK